MLRPGSHRPARKARRHSPRRPAVALGVECLEGRLVLASVAAADVFRAHLANAADFTGPDTPNFVNLKYSNIDTNTAGIVVQASGALQVTQAGLYTLKGDFDFLAPTTNYLPTQILVNGSPVDLSLASSYSGRWSMAEFNLTRQFQAGDLIQIQTLPSGIVFMDNSPWSNLDIIRYNTVDQAPTASAFRGRLTNAFEFAGPTAPDFIPLKFNDVELNSAGLGVNPDGALVVSQAGLYTIAGNFDFFSDAGVPYVETRITVNNNVIDNSLATSTGAQWNMAHFGVTRQFQAGDVIRVLTQPSAIQAMDNGIWSDLNVVRYNTVGQTPAADGLRARLVNAADFTVPDSPGPANLKYLDVLYNSAGIGMSPDGSLVIPRSGLYTIAGDFDVFGASAPHTVTQIVVNGNPVQADLSLAANVPNRWGMARFGLTRPFLAGDVIKLQTQPSAIAFMDNVPWSNLDVIRYNEITVNQAPVASAQSVGTAEDTATPITLSATDADGNPLTYTVVTGPAHGTLSGVAPNLVYTPAANYNGPDSFTFKANDGTVDSGLATVTIAVTPVNDAPTAATGVYITDEDTPVSIVLSGSDVENSPLGFNVLDAPSHGTLSGTGSTRLYTPHANYNGPDSFTFRSNDGSLESVVTLVSINVRAVNDQPFFTAAGDVTVDENSGPVTRVGWASFIGPGPADEMGQTWSFEVIGNTNPGLFAVPPAISPGGTLTYTPAANVHGVATITVRLVDSGGTSSGGAPIGTEFRVNTFTAGTQSTESTSSDRTVAMAPDGSFVAVWTSFGQNGDAADVYAQRFRADGSPAGPEFRVNDVQTGGQSQPAVATDANGNFTVVWHGDFEVYMRRFGATGTALTGDVLVNQTTANIQWHPALAMNAAGESVIAWSSGPNGGPYEVFARRYAPDGSPRGNEFKMNTSAPSSGSRLNKSLAMDSAGGFLIVWEQLGSSSRVIGRRFNSSGVGLADEFNVPAAQVNMGERLPAVAMDALGNALVVWSNQNGSDYSIHAQRVDAGGNRVGSRFTVQSGASNPNMPRASVAFDAAGNSYITWGGYSTGLQVENIWARRYNAADQPQGTAFLVNTTASQTSGRRHNPAVAMNGAGDAVIVWTAVGQDGSDAGVYARRIEPPRGGEVAASAPQSFTITVNAVNRAPVALGDSYSFDEDTPRTVTVPTVLSNDSDDDGDPLTAVLVSGPAHGSLILNPDGSFTYTPAANYNGPDSFVYQASDGDALSNAVTVGLTVSAVNDGPTAVGQTLSTAEETSLGVSVTGTDVETAAASLAVRVTALPGHGTLLYGGIPVGLNQQILGGPAQLVYSPAANYNGADSFRFTVTDDGDPAGVLGNALTSAEGVVSINVTAVNDAPVAVGDSYGVVEDTPRTVIVPTVLSNDSDADGDPLTAVLVSGPAHGSLILNPGGSFTYTPATNYNGPDSFVYRAFDGNAYSNAVTVDLTVSAVNDAPSANGQPLGTFEDVPVSFVLTGSDVETAPAELVFRITAMPLHGGLRYNGGFVFPGIPFTGSPALLEYLPALNYNGPDSFRFTVTDTGDPAGTPGNARTSTEALVSINVSPVNDPPSASPNSYSTNEDTTLTVSTPGVLNNDSDVDGPSLSAILFSGPSNGSVNLNPNGSFSYTPAPNFNGVDTFTYRAFDGIFFSNVTTVSITVIAVNDPPVANNDSYGTNEDQALSIAGPGVLVNDSDPDGNPITAVFIGVPAHGTLVLNPNGSFTYTPAANYNGPDSFTYRAFDGIQFSGLATVSINVVAVNDAPVANDDSYSTNEDQALSVPAPGVLSNDSDADGNPLTPAVVTGPAHGTLTLNSDGSFLYTPTSNYNGSDSFTYRVFDGIQFSGLATVSIGVVGVNDAPVANNDSFTTNEDQALSAPAPGVLSNDADPDGNPITAVLVSGPAHGTLVFGPGGSFTYTPAANFNGNDSFSYRADDGSLTSGVATVSITVIAQNDPPVAVDDVLGGTSRDEDHAFTVSRTDLLQNDVDNDGEVLSVGSVLAATSALGATLFVQSNGDIEYDPRSSPTLQGLKAGVTVVDTFSYRASDGSAFSNFATVSLTIVGLNDAPTADSGALLTDEDKAADGTVSGQDVDGDALTYWVVTPPSHGTLALDPSGAYTYTPAADYHGSDSFSFQARDGVAASGPATVTITINADEDPPASADDSYTATEDTTLSIAAPGVLANDVDADGDTITAVLVVAPSHGTLTLNPDGSFSYTPHANFNGSDGFSYRSFDGTEHGNVATVAITIEAVNDAPAASGGSLTTIEDTAASGLVSASDVDHDPLGYSVVSTTAHGVLVLNPNGTYTYTPDPDFRGDDSFTFRANDGTLDSNVATVSIAVGAVNDAPVVTLPSFAPRVGYYDMTAGHGVFAQEAPIVAAGGVPVPIFNLSAAELAGLDVLFVQNPSTAEFGPEYLAHLVDIQAAVAGGLTLVLHDRFVDAAESILPGGGGFTIVTDFSDDRNIDVLDPSSLVASGPGGQVNNATLDGGTRSNHGYALGSSLPGTARRLLSTSDPSHVVAFSYGFGAGSVVYAAVPLDFYLDGDGPAGVSTNFRNVYGTNIVAYATSLSRAEPATAEDSPLSVHGVSVADPDVDDAPDGALDVTVTVEHGTVTLAGVGGLTSLNGNGTGTVTFRGPLAEVNEALDGLVYMPAANFNGLATLTVSANDLGNTGIGGAKSHVASTRIIVRPVNDAPTAASQSVETDEDTPLPITLGGADVDRDLLDFVVLVGPAHGTLSGAGGAVVYTPDANYDGPDSFTFRSTDGVLSSEPATVTITVNATNDPPVASDDAYSTHEDDALTIGPAAGILTNDSDTDGDPLALTLIAAPEHGTLALAGDGSFTYTPDPNYAGSDGFSYAISDGQGGTATASVALTVVAVADAPALAVSAAGGTEGTPFTVVITPSLTDTDGSEILLDVRVRGVPLGASFNRGALVGTFDGLDVWSIAADQLGDLTMTVPDGPASFVLTITAFSRETANLGTAESSKPLTVEVTNVAPAATIDAPSSVDEGSPIVLSLLGAADISPVDQAAGFAYAFDFGDGYGAFGPGSSASFIPADNGMRTVRAKVRDKDGDVSEYTATVEVKNVAPTATIDSPPASSPEGTPITLTATVDDPGPADTHTYQWSVTKDGAPYRSGTSAGFSFTPDDEGSYVVTLIATDDDGAASAPATATIDVTNAAPENFDIDVDSHSIDENGIVTLVGSFTDANPLDSHTVTITWGEGSPQVIPLAPGQSSFSAWHRYRDDRPSTTPSDTYAISVTVDDGDGGISTRSTGVAVNNVAPVIGFLGSNSPSGNVKQGDPVILTGMFGDVGAYDTHTAVVDWGDGSSTPVPVAEAWGIGGFGGAHTYAGAGIYTITVSLTDDDGGTAVRTTRAVVAGAAVKGRTLYVIGTDRDDDVTINAQGNGEVKVHADFLAGNSTTFSASAFDSIVVLLGDGNDRATVAGSVSKPVLMSGGDGDDQLNGGGGGNILIGGDGDDTLNGGSARDLLIGGRGRDRIVGNSADDILIGGSTVYDGTSSYDVDIAALQAVMDEWNKADGYETRTSRIRLGFLRGTRTINLGGVNVVDDVAADVLTGSSGRDWFFLDGGDSAGGRGSDELDG